MGDGERKTLDEAIKDPSKVINLGDAKEAADHKIVIKDGEERTILTGEDK